MTGVISWVVTIMMINNNTPDIKSWQKGWKKKEEQAQNCYCYYQNGGKEKVKQGYEITKNLYLGNSLQSIQRIIEWGKKRK